MSISGGLDKAIDRIMEIGGNTVQIFSSSPRMWQADYADEKTVEKFKKKCQTSNISPVFIHAKYLINLGTGKKELLKKSINSLVFDLKTAEKIGALGVVVHLGSHLGEGFKKIEKQLVESIKTILDQTSKNTELIIENSAGQKGKIGSQISEIGLILGKVNSTRLSVCLDSCHAWSTAYSLGKDSEKLIDELIYFDILDKLRLLHINDSRDELGSGRDRHANLLEGRMGEKELKAWATHPKLNHLPLIIETPGFDGLGPDKKNLDILKSLIND